jgi:rubrerythrin
MKLRTKTNLTTAMQCGSLDAAKYQGFAACARMDGDWELAKAFQDATDIDRTQHFSREAELEGLIADSPDNLRNTIDSEAKEAHMFAEFAREAMEDGDLNAAALFNRISRDKTESCSRFQAILAEMGLHSDPRNLIA